MNNEEMENEGGVTLGFIFRTIFSQKWLALLIAAVITVIGTVGLYYMGKSGVTYTVSFVLQMPKTGDASATTYSYPDGESFYFTDLISRDNLKNALGDEAKVDEMVKNSDISIARAVDKLDDTSTDGVYDLNYTIKVKAKYFEDEDEARSFIEKLVDFPRAYIANMKINYDKSLTTSENAITYGEQLDLLSEQTRYIQSIYGVLIGAYGNEFIVDETGRTLAHCKNEIDAYINKDLFTSLKNTAKKEGYIKSGSEEKLKYESDLYTCQQALTRAENALEELKKFSAGTGSIIYDEIISLTKEIEALRQEEEILLRYIASFGDTSKIAPEAFKTEVDKVYKTVKGFTDGIEPVANSVYGKVTKINYLSTKVVEVEGGRSIIMSAAISLVAGLVLAMIVAYIVGWNKQRKTKVATVAMPVYSDVQLQIAMTDETAATEDEDKKDDK